MKALAIIQPWCWLIVRPDIVGDLNRSRAYASGQIKDIENRSWGTKHRGQFLVHASKGMTKDEYLAGCNFAAKFDIEVPPMNALERGGIVGIVDLVDSVNWHRSPWYMGDMGFTLNNARPLVFTPMKGALGFFKVPDEVLSTLKKL